MQIIKRAFTLLPALFILRRTHSKTGGGSGGNDLVQFSRSVVSNSLRPHEPQHARLPSPLLIPGACSDSCPSVMPSNPLVLCHPLLLLPSIILTWLEGVVTLYFNFCASHSTLWYHVSLTQTQEVSGGSSLHFTGVQTQPWKDWAILKSFIGFIQQIFIQGPLCAKDISHSLNLWGTKELTRV